MCEAKLTRRVDIQVACGYIIPLGAVCELIGLATYAAKYQSALVTISMAITLGLCILTTLLAALSGWRAGTQRQEVVEEAQRRARYWNDGRPCTIPHRDTLPHSTPDAQDYEEGIALINSTR